MRESCVSSGIYKRNFQDKELKKKLSRSRCRPRNIKYYIENTFKRYEIDQVYNSRGYLSCNNRILCT